MSHEASSSTVLQSIQPYVDRLGSQAKSSTPAYTLAGLFALCAPFGFAGGRDRERLPSQIPGQEAAKRIAGKSIAAATLRPAALPPYWQLIGFAATIGGGGYIIDQGDVLNGAGTVTAWSGIYLFFNTIRTLRQPTLLSALLTTSTAVLGAGVHGSYYFSKTSWRGAIPGLNDVRSS